MIGNDFDCKENENENINIITIMMGHWGDAVCKKKRIQREK